MNNMRGRFGFVLFCSLFLQGEGAGLLMFASIVNLFIIYNVMWKILFVQLSIYQTDIKWFFNQAQWTKNFDYQFVKLNSYFVGLWLIEVFYFLHIDYSLKIIITANIP